MRWIVAFLISLPGLAPLHAGSVEPIGAEPVPGKIELDSGGFIFRPDQGAAVKADFGNIYRVQFEAPVSDDCVPGIVLTDGTRLAAPYGPLGDPAVKFPKRNITIPAAEIAWIIFQRFPAAQAAAVPAGETGAVLPGGDFFSGTVRSADADAVKVMNSILGPRKFDIKKHEVSAAAMRPARPLTAFYEIRTTDGSVFAADSFVSEHAGVTIRNPLYDGLKIPAPEVAEIRAGVNRCRPLASIPMQAEPAAGLHLNPTAPDGGVTSDLKTVVTCPVPSGFTEFVTRVAPVADLPAGQRIIFILYVNGALAARSTPQAAGDPPQVLRIPLNGARVLNLRVESSGPAAAGGSGRWMQPLFVRR